MTHTQQPAKRRQRFMLLGAVAAGKTSILRALEGRGEAARKTQMVDRAGAGIDTPGEYSQMAFFRQHLLAVSSEADLLVVLQDATKAQCYFPPRYFLMYSQRVIGVVNKIDLAGANVERATRQLRESGVSGEIFAVSALTGAGLEALRRRLSGYGLDQDLSTQAST